MILVVTHTHRYSQVNLHPLKIIDYWFDCRKSINRFGKKFFFFLTMQTITITNELWWLDKKKIADHQRSSSSCLIRQQQQKMMIIVNNDSIINQSINQTNFRSINHPNQSINFRREKFHFFRYLNHFLWTSSSLHYRILYHKQLIKKSILYKYWTRKKWKSISTKKKDVIKKKTTLI